MKLLKGPTQKTIFAGSSQSMCWQNRGPLGHRSWKAAFSVPLIITNCLQEHPVNNQSEQIQL